MELGPDLYNDSYADYATAPIVSAIPPPHHPELARKIKGEVVNSFSTRYVQKLSYSYLVSEKRPAWDHPEQNASQKPKGEYSSFAKKMMVWGHTHSQKIFLNFFFMQEKAGWKEGAGLGREVP